MWYDPACFAQRGGGVTDRPRGTVGSRLIVCTVGVSMAMLHASAARAAEKRALAHVAHGE